MEMTSGEILDLIRKNSEAQSVYDNLRQILQLADFVKFAKMNPLPDENDLSMMNAYLFVNQTKVEEVPEPTASQDGVDREVNGALTGKSTTASPGSQDGIDREVNEAARYQPKSTNDSTKLKD
jgi:hypothetical protein